MGCCWFCGANLVQGESKEKKNKKIFLTNRNFRCWITPMKSIWYNWAFLPDISPSYIRIFIPEKSIHSFTRRLFLLDFQLFWVWRLWFLTLHSAQCFDASFFLLVNGFSVWRLALSTLHKRSPPVWMLSCPCECFVFQAFTLETTENQPETHVVWRGEYFFREIYHVYTRARKTYSPNGLRLLQCDLPASSARSDMAWCSFHKSPTIFYNSASWQNNSRTFGNNSRTF